MNSKFHPIPKRKGKKLFDIKDKVIIITGAAGLLGKELIYSLADEEAKIVAVDLPEILDKLKLKKKEHKKRILKIGVDITKKKEVEKLLEKTLKKFKRIDVLINNAQGITKGPPTSFEKYKIEDWEAIMKVNLTAVFLCSQVIGGQMIKQKKGNIINLASTYGMVAPDHRIYKGTKISCPPVYPASKGGVIMLTKYLATYWADKGIRVNAISPHGIYNKHEPRFLRNLSFRSPFGRMADKKEIVGAVIYLISDASSYVTGSNLLVDGGWTAW